MARSDLLISLVKAGSSGDSRSVRATAEAIIAEEKAKNHNVLADRLTKAMHVNGHGNDHKAPAVLGGNLTRHREFLLELTPQKRIEDLVLAALNRRACAELVEEQQRATAILADPQLPGLALLPDQLEDVCDPEVPQVAGEPDAHAFPFRLSESARTAAPR